MNYIILIILGIAGVMLGTYLGRRRKMKKEGKVREDVEKKKENLEKIRSL